MKTLFLFFALGTSFLLAQEPTPTPSLPNLTGRYQIYVVGDGTIIKLDTLTGESWHLQFATPEMKQRGVFYIWTAIPTFALPNLTK